MTPIWKSISRAVSGLSALSLVVAASACAASAEPAPEPTPVDKTGANVTEQTTCYGHTHGPVCTTAQGWRCCGPDDGWVCGVCK